MISAEEANLKIVVGVSGASGAIYGVRLLEKLRLQSGVEMHLILTPLRRKDVVSRNREKSRGFKGHGAI